MLSWSPTLSSFMTSFQLTSHKSPVCVVGGWRRSGGYPGCQTKWLFLTSGKLRGARRRNINIRRLHHRHLAVSLVTAPLSLSAAEAVNWLVSAPASDGLARCRGQPCRGVMNAMFISEMGLFLRNLIKYLNVWLLLRWSLNTSCRIYLCI